MTWFHSDAVQFPRARHHSKRMRRWVGVRAAHVMGVSISNVLQQSALRMVREDTGAPNEGATCGWMAADEEVECTRAFLTIWRSS
ncbi:uncharacterized protein TNCV_450271 [Trichonephila clavipes]|nr:uncharacterized protein TNCV_450271 [Trichonephila clavipes]